MRSERGRAVLGFIAFGGFWGVWGAVLPQLQDHADVDDAHLGTALLFIGLGALLTIRATGALADRFPRATLPTALAALAVAGAVPVMVVHAGALSVAMFGLGVTSGVADAAINAAAGRVELAGRPVLSVGHGAFSAAVVATSLGVAALSSDRAARPWPLVAVAILILGAALGTALLPTSAAGPAVTASTRRWASMPLVVLGLLAAVAYLVENAWQSWGAIHLHSTLGASLQIAALAPALFAGSAATGRFAGHYLTEHIPAAGLLSAGACAAAAGSLLAALAHTPWAALVGIVIAGLGTSVCAPTLIGIAARRAPGASGAATSTVITLAYLGFVVGPAAVGLLSGATTLPTALVAVAVLAAALALISPATRRLDPARAHAG